MQSPFKLVSVGYQTRTRRLGRGHKYKEHTLEEILPSIQQNNFKMYSNFNNGSRLKNVIFIPVYDKNTTRC